MVYNLNTGSNLHQAFRIQSVGARGEIALFQAFIRSFNALGPGALAKEYHGNRYQVTFQQARGAGRSNPRCELCDVLIVQYPEDNPNDARLTFNQAKVSSNPFSCNRMGIPAKPYKFRANLEQWDLLSNRPLISSATRKFNPPKNLLTAAILPSVGSFGVFYPSGDAFDFAYFVADGLQPHSNNSGREGTLSLSNPLLQYRQFSRYKEINGTCCMQMFGEALDLGVVGTPAKQLLNQPAASREIKSWLSSILIGLQREYPDSQLPQELLQGLELQVHAERMLAGSGRESPPRAVVLLRTPGKDRNSEANKSKRNNQC